MKRILFTVAAFGLFFMSSCDNTTEVEQETQTEEVESTEVEHDEHDDHHAHDDGEEIALNEGNKWKINEEMTPFVEEGEALVVGYIGSGDEDYLSLAEDLSSQNSQLISSCTMEGVSHDELHKWLHPHLELTKALKNAGDIEEANEIVDQLADSYLLFHEFFE